jgi:photosystem II stability/assembly factor-like uncharacterized protein
MRRSIVNSLRRAHLAALATLVLGLASPSAASNLFGLIDTGEIYRSTDNGANWSVIATLPVRDAVALSARLTTSDLFLLTGSGDVYRSLDAGFNWSAVGTVTARDGVDLTIPPDGSLLVLTGTGSVYQSVDEGVTFTPLAALAGSNFRSLVFTTSPLNHYALTATGEVYESTDGGAGWTPKGAIPVPDARRIQTVGGTLYVISEAADVYRSVDRGVSWSAVGTLSQVGTRGFARNAGALVAATREGDVATSADGTSWAWQGSINQLELTALATDEPAVTSVDGFPGGALSLGPAYPNPSTGALTLAIRLDHDTDVWLALYDVSGRRVAVRAPERFPAGSRTITWQPGAQGPGLYFVRLQTPEGHAATRWTLIR